MSKQPTAFLETRPTPKTNAALASTVISHWHSRYLYSKALVIVEEPEVFLKLAKRRWLTLMQQTQAKRAGTFDADHILQLTHAITRMQQVVMTKKLPYEQPNAHMWCLTPRQLKECDLPRTCQTLYNNTSLSLELKEVIYEILPSYSIVVDYTNDSGWLLPSKSLLEERVHEAWQELTTFLAEYKIYPKRLIEAQGTTIDAVDDALDTLLEVSHSFLRHARQFQETLHLAQPLTLDHMTKREYDITSLLARRVAMLSPGIMQHSMIQADQETFFLYDTPPFETIIQETLRVAIARHAAAGRERLARALRTAFLNNAYN